MILPHKHSGDGSLFKKEVNVEYKTYSIKGPLQFWKYKLNILAEFQIHNYINGCKGEIILRDGILYRTCIGIDGNSYSYHYEENKLRFTYKFKGLLDGIDVYILYADIIQTLNNEKRVHIGNGIEENTLIIHELDPTAITELGIRRFQNENT